MPTRNVVSNSFVDSDFFLSVDNEADAIATPNSLSDIVDVTCGRIMRQMMQKQDLGVAKSRYIRGT
jgi:hypothetical protein